MHERGPAAVGRQQQHRHRWQLPLLPWRRRGRVKQVRCHRSWGGAGLVAVVDHTMQLLPCKGGGLLLCGMLAWLGFPCTMCPHADPVAASIHQRAATGGFGQLEGHEDPIHHRLGLVSGHLTATAFQAVQDAVLSQLQMR